MMKSVLVLATIILSGLTDQIIACDCIGRATVEQEIKKVEAVIVGTIVSKELVTVIDSTLLEIFQSEPSIINTGLLNVTIAKYGLNVHNIYKGEISIDTISIYTGLYGGDCGVDFLIGGKYIVYGDNSTFLGQRDGIHKFPSEKNAFWTDICLRTMSFSNEEITEIEKYTKRKHHDLNHTNPVALDNFPTFKDGGEKGHQIFIENNLHYPKPGEFLTGKVHVEVTIDSNGMVTDAKIRKGLTAFTNEEAIRVVKLMRFNPGTKGGKPVEMNLIIPISFTLKN